MAKLTWLGEDELHGGGAGPSFTTAFDGIKFPKGEAVEVRSYGFVQKALNNPFFEVEDADDVDDAPAPSVREIPAPPKRGRPTNAERAARDAKERDESASLAEMGD